MCVMGTGEWKLSTGRSFIVLYNLDLVVFVGNEAKQAASSLLYSNLAHAQSAAMLAASVLFVRF